MWRRPGSRRRGLRYDEIVEKIGAAVAAMPVGLPDSPGAIGPLISAKQRERVESHIEKGKQEGARLVTGGGRLRVWTADITCSQRFSRMWTTR